MRTKKQYGWCLIPPQIFSRQDLLPSEKLLIGRIIGLANDKGYCYASNQYLGEQISTTKGRMANMLMRLHKSGFLKIEHIRSENQHITERRIFPIYEDLPEEGSPTGEGGIHLQVKGYSPTGEGGIHLQVKDSNKYKRNKYRDNILSEVLQTSDESIRLASILFSEIIINGNSTRLHNLTEKEIEKTIHTWAKDIDKLIRIDRQNPSIVEEVIRFAAHDGFWGPNVLSGRKLREKWDILVARKKQNVSISQQAKAMQNNRKKEVSDDERLAIIRQVKASRSSVQGSATQP